MLDFIKESTKDFKETTTIGSFENANKINTYDAIFESAANAMKKNHVNVMLDINDMVKKPAVMQAYKNSIINGLGLDSTNPREAVILEQVSQMWDNCTEDYVKESTRVGQLLPFKAMDLPILVKQHLAVASKDIMQTEVTNSPLVKKQMERRWIVDSSSGKKWEYPQCFFKEEFKEIYKAGKGFPIKNTKVNLPIFNYDIVENLTDGNPSRDKLSYNIKIIEAYDATGNKIPLDMYPNMNDGRWLHGEINHAVDASTKVEDLLTGSVNFATNAVSLNACNGKIASVVFSGYLSNELNERSLTFDYTREEREWKIEDGFRMNVPYSLEELEDAKALLDLDLYKKTYDNLTDILIQGEDSGILDFLDDEFTKYESLELDPLGFNSFIRKAEFDCDHTSVAGVLQSDYVQTQLKWRIDRFIQDIADTCKMEDLTFVCYGNPVYISLLGDKVNWVVKSGDMVGGVKANYSYGVMNSGNIKIQVVAANKINKQTHKTLRLIPYPLNKEQMTFKHYKYTTHILTTENSGYKNPDRPGGSMTNLMATNRCATAAIQGIQGDISFKNIDFVLDK